MGQDYSDRRSEYAAVRNSHARPRMEERGPGNTAVHGWVGLSSFHCRVWYSAYLTISITDLQLSLTDIREHVDVYVLLLVVSWYCVTSGDSRSPAKSNHC
jgi:hypothetical protein